MNENPRRDGVTAGAKADQFEQFQLTASPVSTQRFHRAVADVSETDDLLIAALAYARAGLPIFPCSPKNKQPLVLCGFKDATTQEKQIRTWWSRWPDAMIGLPTGAETGVFGLDVDRNERTDGFAALASLEKQHGNLPETLRSVTPRGSAHYFFTWHDAIKNTAGKLGLGLDVRGDGGYVILPPSRRDDGKSYEWTETSAPTPIEAPRWLIDLLLAPKEKLTLRSQLNTRIDGNGNANAYARAALERECADIATSQVGMRNDALNRASYNLHQLVAAGALAEGEVHDRLFGAAIACGLVKEDGADAVLATIKSGATAGLRIPRTIPEQPIHNANGNGAKHGNANREESLPRSVSALISRCAADIVPEKIDWLWPGRIARGKYTCIAGEPGTGKSQLAIAVIAAVTTGGEWPCVEGRAPLGNAIILSAEDGAGDTIIPRLMVAGADLNRVHVVSAVRNADGSRRTLNLQNDLGSLETKIAEVGDVALVVVDPVSSYLGKTDSHKNSEVRGVLEPLSEMAERTRVAILSVTHFSKAGANGATKALHRIIGSVAFTGAPRAAFAVIEDAEYEGRRLFLHAKNNLARAPQGLAFRLEQSIVGDEIVASRVLWDAQPVAITANEALAADLDGTQSRTAKAEAMELLEGALAGGPMPAAEVNRMAREHGLTPKVLRSAREALSVGIKRDGYGLGSKSLWSLPNWP
jgi:hypothetical protein